MTTQDVAELQTLVDALLPQEYVEALLSGAPRLEGLFYNRDQILEANKQVRTRCWRGEPLDRFFFVFGQDDEGRVLFLDLDLPGGAVMRQDETSPDPQNRSKMLSSSFAEWKTMAEQAGAYNP